VVNFFRFERKDLGVYVANVILISLITSALVLGVASIVFTVASFDLLVSPIRWLPLIAVAALSQVLFSIALTLWQVEQRPLPYGLFQILHTALNVALSLTFVIVFSWGWRGRVLAVIVGSVAFGLLSLVIVYRHWYAGMTVRRDYIKDALAFGIPLVPHSLGNWILTGIDRIFIASMIGIAATGIYTVGYQIGMIVGLIATSFNQAWSPFLFEKLKENSPQSKVRIVKFTYAYIPAILLLAVILSVVAPWFLTTFVGPEFRGAQQYVFWIALGYAANGMYMMVANYIFYAKKTHLLAAVTLFTAAVNVGLNYVLIRANGPVGAAQASAASFFLGFVLTWILSAKVYRMPWRLWSAADLGGVPRATGN